MRLKSTLFGLSLLALIYAQSGYALWAYPQHEEHQHKPSPQPTNQATEDHEPMSVPEAKAGVWGSMDTRNASGTSWQPKDTPEAMVHRMVGGWMLMLHGNAFLSVNRQGGLRGITKVDSSNWAMLMAEHAFGPGRLMARTMLTLEPWTIPHGGTPQLFQTGETYRGRPIVDHQHPHNFIMELAAMYTLPLSEKTALQIYGGPVGEPALGPPAFMHRLSASELPTVPLGHHLADSTHISEGVATLGLIYHWMKVEASAFNGHEPGEDRWGIHTSGLNSYAFRVSANPTDRWSMQVSAGHLRKPEASLPIVLGCGGGGPPPVLPPGVVFPHVCQSYAVIKRAVPSLIVLFSPGNVVRSTASIMYHRPLATGYWATTLLWGRNRETQAHRNSYLVESMLNFKRKNYASLRWELVDKHGLLGDPLPPELAFADRLHVGAYTFGFVRDVPLIHGLATGIGGEVTFYSKPPLLDYFYGNSPVSFHVFLRLRPQRSEH
jgi:hypothetical protein